MSLRQWGWIRSERNGLSHVVLVLKLEMRRWMEGRPTKRARELQIGRSSLHRMLRVDRRMMICGGAVTPSVRPIAGNPAGGSCKWNRPEKQRDGNREERRGEGEGRDSETRFRSYLTHSLFGCGGRIRWMPF